MLEAPHDVSRDTSIDRLKTLLEQSAPADQQVIAQGLLSIFFRDGDVCTVPQMHQFEINRLYTILRSYASS